MDSISAITSELLERYQTLLHERLVSRRAAEDYVYWVRRFLSERSSLDTLPTEAEVDRFVAQLRKESNTGSTTRRAEVALELFTNELLVQAQVA